MSLLRICYFLSVVDDFGVVFFFQAEDGIRDADVTGVQTCALPIWRSSERWPRGSWVDQADLLRHLVDALEALDIPYMIGGAQAALYYGEPRLTRDIDVVA